MARRGENIYKRKDGRWEGRYVIGKRDNGKTAFASIYGRTYSEVKKRLIVCKANRKENKCNFFHRTTFRDGTTKAWLSYWLEEEVKPQVKSSTYAVYRGHVERHMIPAVGSELLTKVSNHSMEVLYQRLIKRSISHVTAIQICKRFLAALSCAREVGLVETLPVIPTKKKKTVKKRTRFLGITEQKKLEENLDEEKPKDLAVLLSLYSGCRLGECCAFRWEDFDSLAGGIHITHSLQRITVYQLEKKKTALLYDSPKSESSERFIPLPKFMITALSKHKRLQQAQSQDFIFGNGSKPLDPRVLQYHISRLSTSLELKGLHFHTLRHTFATRFMEKNGDVVALKEILGHSSAKITMDWYGHTTELHMRKSMQKLTKLAA